MVDMESEGEKAGEIEIYRQTDRQTEKEKEREREREREREGGGGDRG